MKSWRPSVTNFFQQFVHKCCFAVVLSLFLYGCGCQSDPELGYAKGQSAFDNADYKTAAENFAAVVEQDPGNIDALVMLARSECALGNYDAAASAVEKAAETNGGDVDIIELSAQIAFYRKDYKQATKAYHRLAGNLELSPAVRSVGWAGLGAIDFFMIDKQQPSSTLIHEARVKFLQAIFLDNKNATAHYHLALLNRDSFHYLDKARDEFSAYLYLEDVVDERVNRVKNEILPSLKDEIKKSAESANDDVDLRGCAAMLKKGKTYYDRKQYKEAVDAYSRALKCNPNSYQAALDLARSYVSVNRSRYDKEHALKAYQKACKIRPSAIKLHLDAGNLAMRIEKWAVAVELYSRALSASPTSVEAVKGLVAALEKQGDSQAASVYRGYLRTLTKK